MVGNDRSDIRLAVAQGTMLWQPVTFGDIFKCRHVGHLLFALAFDNGFEDHEAA